MPRVDNQEKVFVEYEGYVVYSARRSFGLAFHPPKPNQRNVAELHVPKSQCGRITYAGCRYRQAGDHTGAVWGAKVEAIEVPRWWARQNGLLGWNE